MPRFICKRARHRALCFFVYDVIMVEVWKKQLADHGTITILVKIHSNAPKNKVKGTMDDGTVKIDIAAVPEDGKANRALIQFLAQELDVDRTSIAIKNGSASSRKVLEIHR